MNIPGFTAVHALYKRGSYRFHDEKNVQDSLVVPAQLQLGSCQFDCDYRYQFSRNACTSQYGVCVQKACEHCNHLSGIDKFFCQFTCGDACQLSYSNCQANVGIVYQTCLAGCTGTL